MEAAGAYNMNESSNMQNKQFLIGSSELCNSGPHLKQKHLN